MKNYVKIILPLFLFILLFNGCKKTDPPKADFIYTVDILTVTFDNLTTGADSYLWDFGDGNTSTEENPVHTYTDGGTFTVSLKATNEGGDDTYTEDITLVKPAATIDGAFTEWDDYTALYSDPDADNGTLLEAKITYDAAFLFIYVKGNSSTGPVIQVYFDKDNSGATGWDYWGAYDTPGLDYLLEYVVEDFTGQYGDATAGATLLLADEEDWPWNTTASENAVTATSGYVDVQGNKLIEFSVARSLMADLGTTIRISFQNSDNDWEEAGSLPQMWLDPPATLNTFTFE